MNSIRNLRIVNFISLITIFPLIMVRSQQFPPQDLVPSDIMIWNLTISKQTYPIDTVMWFVLFLIGLIFFGVTLGAVSENLLLDFETNFKKVKLHQAIEIKRPSLAEKLPGKPELKKPQITVDDIRAKAKERKEAMLKKLEAEKKEEIEKVMGDKIETIKGDKLEKQINPEVVRLDALIRSVKTILRATPAFKVVTLEEIQHKLSNKVKITLDEIESIIIGLKKMKKIESAKKLTKISYISIKILE